MRSRLVGAAVDNNHSLHTARVHANMATKEVRSVCEQGHTFSPKNLGCSPRDRRNQSQPKPKSLGVVPFTGLYFCKH